MSTSGQPPIQHCGHRGQTYGLCQYQGCAAELCQLCTNRVCQTCQRMLCPQHQVWTDNQTRVFCEDHAENHLLITLLRWLIPGTTP